MKKILFILLFLPFISKAQLPLIVNGWASCDADAQTFIDSAGITDPVQIAAICTLVKDMKDSSVWTPMKAIYPFIGGTAASHKWNLKDPRNLDAAFRLTFTGGWTHSSTGAKPNGTNGYANTFLIPSTTLSANSVSVSYYSRDSVVGVKEAVAAFNGGGQEIQLFFNNGSTGDITFDAYAVSQRITSNTGNTKGYFIGSRSSSTSVAVYKNGISLATKTTTDGTLPTVSFYISAANTGVTPILFNDAETAFSTISDGLTANQVRALNFIVEKYNDALSRGVQ